MCWYFHQLLNYCRIRKLFLMSSSRLWNESVPNRCWCKGNFSVNFAVADEYVPKCSLVFCIVLAHRFHVFCDCTSQQINKVDQTTYCKALVTWVHSSVIWSLNIGPYSSARENILLDDWELNPSIMMDNTNQKTLFVSTSYLSKHRCDLRATKHLSSIATSRGPLIKSKILVTNILTDIFLLYHSWRTT